MTNQTNIKAADVADALRQRFAEADFLRARQYARERYPELAGQETHVKWCAARVLDAAEQVRGHAELREEETIDRLVDARNAGESTLELAETVVAAARRVEELEQIIETLANIVAVDPAPADTSTDDDETPAGDCDA